MEFDASELFPRFLLNDQNGFAIAKATELAMNLLAYCLEESAKLVDLDGIQAGKYSADEIPEWRLDEIAWSYNTFYLPDAPVDVKLQMVRNAMRYFQRAGTQSVIDMILSTINQTLPVPVSAEASGNQINLSMASDDTELVDQTLAMVRRYLYDTIPIKAKLRAAALELDFTRKWAGRIDLTSIDLSPWQGKTIVGMTGAFSGCSNLESVTTATMDTTMVTNIDDMYNGCDKLSVINLSDFNLSNVTSARNAFARSLEDGVYLNLNVRNQNLSSVTDMSGAFDGVTGMTVYLDGTTGISADIDLYTVKKVSAIYFTENPFAVVASGSRTIRLNPFVLKERFNSPSGFRYMNDLLIGRGWNIAAPMYYEAEPYYKAEATLDLSYIRKKSIKIEGSGPVNCFRYIPYKTIKGLGCFDITGQTSIDNMFNNSNGISGYGNLEYADLSDMDWSNVTSAEYALAYCEKMLTLKLPSGSNAPKKLKSIVGAFRNCRALTEIDLDGWTSDTTGDTVKCASAFTSSGLKTIKMGSFDFTNSTGSANLFNYANDLVNLTLKPNSNFGYGTTMVNLHMCHELSSTSIDSIANALQDVSSTGTLHRISFASEAKARMSTTAQNLITSKGWRID